MEKLAGATAPLLATLTPEQKARLPILLKHLRPRYVLKQAFALPDEREDDGHGMGHHRGFADRDEGDRGEGERHGFDGQGFDDHGEHRGWSHRDHHGWRDEDRRYGERGMDRGDGHAWQHRFHHFDDDEDEGTRS